eukprot:m.10078 g.10078  ORF g.10078 m.10078 type:complete len:338 (-) comp4197_c0_seq1:79-1092(-)
MAKKSKKDKKEKVKAEPEPVSPFVAKAKKKLLKKLGTEPSDEAVEKLAKKLEKKANADGEKEEVQEEKEEEPKEKKKKDKKRKAKDIEEEKEEEPEETKKSSKKDKKKKKKAKKEEAEDEAEGDMEEAADAGEEKKEAAAPASGVANPDGLTKCFLGNLSFDIDDDQAKNFFEDCGKIIDVYWLCDKESGKFYGSGFLTFETPEAAAAAVAKAGQDLLGRPLKIEFAKPKAGGAGTPKGGGKKYPVKPMSEKPANCVTMFMGNLSYDIDDDKANEFFSECGAVKKIRWLTDRESGDFKGCGFVEFFDTETVDKAAKLNGEMLLGRQVRLDYATERKQ